MLHQFFYKVKQISPVTQITCSIGDRQSLGLKMDTWPDVKLDTWQDVELFCPVPKPYVSMYGAAENAGGRPLANVIDLLGSPHHYVVVIELPQVQCCDNEVEWVVSADGEVTIEGQITRAAMFANMPIGRKSKRIKLCPTETWAISFFFPTPVDWWTASVLFTSKTEMEISVMKSSSSGLLPPVAEPEAPLADADAEAEAEADQTESEAGPSGVSSPTPSEVEEMIAGWLV